jgi:outer membrane protein TolC
MAAAQWFSTQFLQTARKGEELLIMPNHFSVKCNWLRVLFVSPTANFTLLLRSWLPYFVAKQQIRQYVMYCLCLIATCVTLPAQSEATLTYATYLSVVAKSHPIARQTELLQPQAVATLLAARGMFDTKAYSDWRQKSFDGKRYFTEGASGIETPSWYGLTWKAEYLNYTGAFINPENRLPPIGQAALGLEMSALQGLLTDERRTAIKQAKQLAIMNANERLQVLNELLYSAGTAYWNWVSAHQQNEIIKKARVLAQQRFENQQESFISGDKPAIDTLEAWIQVLTRDAELIDAQRYIFETAHKMAVFVWSESGMPLAPADDLVPDLLQVYVQDTGLPFVTATFGPLVDKHPEVLQYDLKLRALEIEQRLKREKLKPKLQLAYQFLGNGLNLGPPAGYAGIDGVLFQNYKWEISFSQPVFLRKERADLKLNQLKLKENQLSRQLKRQEIQNKQQIAQNQLVALRSEVRLLEQITKNYTTLQEAELTKFQIGESSLFLVNARENKRIESEIKLAKTQAEVKKAEVLVRYASASF